MIAWRAVRSRVRGRFTPGTCFADSRDAAIEYLEGDAGWLYEVDITAQRWAWDDDLVAFAGPRGLGEPDAEDWLIWDVADWDAVASAAEDWGYDLLCHHDSAPENERHPHGLRHYTFRPLAGASVEVRRVTREGPAQGPEAEPTPLRPATAGA